MQTVQSLRKQGLKVRVEHYRKVYDFQGVLELPLYRAREFEMLPHGGHTVVRIFDPSRGTQGVGTSVCGKKDSFCRRMGVEIALGRALKEYLTSPKPAENTSTN